ncbi:MULTISPECIES: TOMM precursor leader peptide-binding protein [Actinomyces]|nr:MULTISPECIES: TOMM precursor leader peptide-binding protein [Actinomyces]
MSDEMEYILEGLIQNDILRPHTGLDTIPPVVAEYCARSGYQVEEAEATRRLHSTRLIVSGDNTSLADLLIAELRSLGITVDTLDTFDAKEGQDFTQMPATAAEKGQESVAVSVHHDILSEASLRQNRLLVEQQFPGRILFVGGFDGKRSVIGPWVVPGSSACLRCWAYRYHANLISVPESVRPGAPKSPWHLHHRPRAPLPAANRLITALTSDLIAEYVTLGPHAPSSQPGTYRVIESSRNGTVLDRHHVLRVPRCDVCSQSRTTGYPQVWHHG